ncbi:hypothetical protein PIGHUM_03301 [Pigmentiphaga humi]|uniref:Lnb N-terminal periplasmic domain-containing protein n=1 Tax=Pigmentiphaga humi TaxID=2478468 RepID=A0A3P4B6J8_9BURK|nr:DUF4105 domain-containing protein [Pigmentiphaga humi]VCU71220.1 hypothetical protein PIGHUM_03301 [Pigmentiphaga humi]
MLRTYLPIALAVLAIVPTTLWSAFALRYQAPGPAAAKTAAALLAALFGLAMLWLALRGRPGWALAAHAAAFCLLLVWWHGIPPSNTRDWADDVARMTTGRVEGSVVTLEQVRNFDWRSGTDYTPRWETRSYDLDRLASVDLFLSYWTIQPIAHTLVSFGYDDGRQLVFSVEIRKERHEAFSSIGGFFKEFETSVVAADERDIVRVRTNARGEDVYLYRVAMPRAAMRSLFLQYIEEANRLVAQPRFYHTITANCTTIVYHMVKRIIPRLPLDYRLILAGYLPGYIYDIGGLDTSHTLDELRERGRITERARAAGDAADFSRQIRRGVPGIPQ